MARSQRVRKEPLYPNSIGYCIKKYGYTRSELAAEIGIDRKTLYFYCIGQLATPKYTLEKIARTLGCSIEELRSSPSTIIPESSADIVVSLPEPVRDTIEAVESHVLSLQQWQAATGQERETFDMDKGRRDLLQQFFSAMAGISLFENKELLLSVLRSPLFQSGDLFSKSLTAISLEEFFLQCSASIKSCWHLIQGREFAVIEEVLSAYFPTLFSLVEQSSEHRKTAASFLTQGYRLRGIVALHYNDIETRATCCQQAVYFGEIAENPSLLVSALTSLASTSYYGSNPHKAAQVYQQGLLHDKEIPPLQLSRLYAELAVVSAQMGQEQESLTYQNMACDVYPEHPEGDPSFLYAEFSPASAILEEGLTHLALAQRYSGRGYGRKAWNAFVQVEALQKKKGVPDRILYEITNQQAATALTLRDLELFCSLMWQAIHGAKLLNSQQRRQEVIANYKEARNTVWPREKRIGELADLLL